MAIRLLMLVLCLIATPAATFASAACCAPADECCSDPCGASECTTAPDDHCALGAGGAPESTAGVSLDAPPVGMPALTPRQGSSDAGRHIAADRSPPAQPRYLRLRTLRN